MKWKTLNSKEIYKNPWIRVREDRVLNPLGKQGVYGVVEIPSGIFVIALNKRKDILLIKQLRYCTNITSWELPGGGLKNTNSLIKQAKEELKEEAQILATDFILLGKTQTQPGVITELDYFFKANVIGKIKTKSNNQQEGEGISNARFFSFTQIKKMMKEGEINHGQSIVGLSLYEVKFP